MKSNYLIKNQSKNVIYCKKCVYSNQKVVPSNLTKDTFDHSNRSFLRFNKEGICTACELVERKNFQQLKFDLIFCDPPFKFTNIQELFELI